MAHDVFVIGPRGGYEGQIGVLASMLQNTRTFLLAAVRDLDTAALDARPAGAVNTIGAILAHLPAAEYFLGVRAFENRRSNEEEQRRYGPAFGFEPGPHASGRSLDSYLATLREIRERTLERMRSRDETWLAEPRQFAGKPANAHYFLYHYIQDEARHTGQIILLRKHLVPGADPEFDPYVF